MEVTDDILLLRLIREGDKHVFKHLFSLYFTPLCRFIDLYLHNHEETEELALDLFMYVWEHREMLQIKLSLKAYLFQSAKNRALNALRDRKETTSLDEVQTELLQGKDYPELEMEELYRLIREAVCALPDRCQEVFKKSRIDNMSNQEIADSMGISVKTVEAQITKALKHIRKYLGEGYSYLF